MRINLEHVSAHASDFDGLAAVSSSRLWLAGFLADLNHRLARALSDDVNESSAKGALKRYRRYFSSYHDTVPSIPVRSLNSCSDIFSVKRGWLALWS